MSSVSSSSAQSSAAIQSQQQLQNTSIPPNNVEPSNASVTATNTVSQGAPSQPINIKPADSTVVGHGEDTGAKSENPPSIASGGESNAGATQAKKEPDSLKKTLQEQIQALEAMRKSVGMLRTLPGLLMRSPWNDGGIGDLSDLGISVDPQVHGPNLTPARRMLQDFDNVRASMRSDSVQAALKMAKESEHKNPIQNAEVLRALRRSRRGLDLSSEEEKETGKKRYVVSISFQP